MSSPLETSAIAEKENPRQCIYDPKHNILSYIRCLRGLWTWSNWYDVPPESTGYPSYSRSHVSPSPSTRVFCGLLIMLGSSLPASASLAPFARGKGEEWDLSLATQVVWAKKPASFMGLFGPGAQICKPKPFISEVHTKVGKGGGK